MTNNPFISICIPAYKRVNYLERLLKSVAVQAYTNYEIIITDDSPADEVKELLSGFDTLPIKYFKNTPSLGTPENWNAGIRKATGEWIKIMHDDDWFSSENSLQGFVDQIQQNNEREGSFFFSAFNSVYEQQNNRVEEVRLDKQHENRLRKDALYLFRKNYIGNPSCILFKKNATIVFDNRFKWVVDFDFYIQYLKISGFVYIDKPLVNVSVNDTQVTTYTFRMRKVEIPESHLMLEKLGIQALRNIYVYDYFWRLYRNLKIKDVTQIKEDGYNGQIMPVLQSMIEWQRKLPQSLLRFGLFSKTLMALHYITHANKLK